MDKELMQNGEDRTVTSPVSAAVKQDDILVWEGTDCNS